MREVSEKKPFPTVIHVIKTQRKLSNHVLQRKLLDAQSVEYIQDKIKMCLNPVYDYQKFLIV